MTLSFADAIANANRGIFAPVPRTKPTPTPQPTAQPTATQSRARDLLVSLNAGMGAPGARNPPLGPDNPPAPKAAPAPSTTTASRASTPATRVPAATPPPSAAVPPERQPEPVDPNAPLSNPPGGTATGTSAQGTVTINGITYDIVNGVLVTGSARQAGSENSNNQTPTTPNIQVPGSDVKDTIPTPTTGTGTPPVETPFDQDVFTQINQLLGRYGLTGLGSWVRELVVNEASASEIQLQLFERQEFKDRFPAIALIDNENKGGIARPNISPEEYLSLEQDYLDLLSRVGLDEAFFTRDRVATWIYEGVSPAEVSRRVTNGFSKMSLASEETREAFKDYFGPAGDAALAAYYLDPDNVEDVLMRQIEVAEIGGSARISGINIGQAQSERLSSLGISPQQASAGFQDLTRRRGLFRETASERRDMTAENEGINSRFGLDSGQSAEDLDRRLASRQAAFQGGGGAFIGQRTTGLGSA
jgi:hypothetical protein